MCFCDTYLMLLPAAALWLVWYSRIMTVTTMASRHADRLLLYLAPVAACLLLLATRAWRPGWDPRPGQGFAVVGAYSSEVLLLAFAAVCLLPWLGLSPRDDVAERRNRYAGWAVVGALLGVALTFAGINTTLFQTDVGKEREIAAVGPLPAMIGFFAVWGTFEMTTRCSEAITVDRDGGAAARLAAFLPAMGLLLGTTIAKFVPLVPSQPPLAKRIAAIAGLSVFFAAAIRIECTRRKSRALGQPSWCDGLIAICYLGGAILWITLV